MFWVHGTVMMVARLRIIHMATIERRGLLPRLLCLLHPAVCETLLHHCISRRHQSQRISSYEIQRNNTLHTGFSKAVRARRRSW
jgi:hypothetical protein